MINGLTEKVLQKNNYQTEKRPLTSLSLIRMPVICLLLTIWINLKVLLQVFCLVIALILFDAPCPCLYYPAY